MCQSVSQESTVIVAFGEVSRNLPIQMCGCLKNSNHLYEMEWGHCRNDTLYIDSSRKL